MKKKITLVKSQIGTIPAHRRTVKALGLRKLNSSVIKEINPSIEGMLNSIGYLLKIEDV